MSSHRLTFIYSLLGLFMLCISIYSMYIFGITHAVFFSNTDLLFPFMQKITLPYNAWNLPSHLMLFPDACIYSICSFFASNTQEAIIFYIITMLVLLYLTLMLTVQRKLHESTLSLYILLWTMLLLLYFGTTSFLVRIFLPNGLLGFLCLYYLATYATYTILYTREPSLFIKLLLFLTLTLLAFTTPILTFILIGIPSLLLSFIQRKLEYPSEKHFQLDVLVTLSISIGFVLQFYLFPSKQTLTLSTLHDSILAIFYNLHPLLIITVALGILYTIFYAFSHISSSTRFMMRITSLAIILGFISSIIGILDSTLYLLFIIFFSCTYALPHCIMRLISLLTMSKVYSINTVFLLATFLITIVLYCNYSFTKEELPSKELISYIDSSLPHDGPQYIFAPRKIATQITLFTTRDIVAIPYATHTFEYVSFTPNEQKPYLYSALVIEKEAEDTLLVNQLLSLIGKPTRKHTIGSYIIMEYDNKFVMPTAGTLATYTTPLGNIIRNSLNQAIHIPQPENFTVNGIPIKEVRLLRDENKSFIALVFDKNTPIPTDTEYAVYTLSPSSTAFRKLASGIRRELPFLSSLLPLEDKSSEYINSTKDIYILQNGDIVIAINCTNHLKEALTFLSIAIGNARPAVVFQYPTPPIQLMNE